VNKKPREIPCPESCAGITVLHMRHGDPIVTYQQCHHGKVLKRQHAKMTNQQIRSSLSEIVKFTGHRRMEGGAG
jgi:hypothetical protein